MALTDSRRLTGPNAYFDRPAAALEAVASGIDEALIACWQAHVAGIASALGWPEPSYHARPHAKGATLAFTAPLDQLYCATDINEWAWSSACGEQPLHAPGFPDIHDTGLAVRTFHTLAAAEAEPGLLAFIAEAESRRWPVLLDDEVLSIGFGVCVRQWPRQPVPARSLVPAAAADPIPVAMVTGSNGKTTSVRLLAAMARAAGLASGYNCTDGLFFNGALLEADDYSGPAGARAILRHAGVQAAILETARGGLLRRGLATDQADAALVTNVSEDHFGEYGIFSLDDLAQVKLAIRRGLKPSGRLLLNAGDPLLVKHGTGLRDGTAWFAADWSCPALQAQLAQGAMVCAVDGGHLGLHADGIVHDLGIVADMPLSHGGVARYNIENLAGAALCAYVLGFGLDAIRATLRHFGQDNADNPGRLQRWSFADVRVFLDYAHNPDGLGGFLGIAQSVRMQGRLAVLLGQAGNRENDDIVKLAEAAAAFHPDLVVLKDMAGYARGRQPGEVPALLHSALSMLGVSEAAIITRLDELEAVRHILQWAQPGDVLALPVHGLAEREAVQSLLDAMQAANWRAGHPVPDWPSPLQAGDGGDATG